jgi:integrase
LLAERPELRPRTRELYQGLLRRHIIPALGSTELTPSQVRVWNAQLRLPSGPGSSTAAKAYRLPRAILRTAVTDEIIVRTPCQLERAGVERAPERPVATVAEVDALADTIAPRFRALVLLAAWCGLRRGELLGLRRSDVDLLHGKVHIQQAMQQMADGTLLFGPPKTDAGRRRVSIPPHLLGEVAYHLDHFTDPDPPALVFAGEKGGPVRPHVLQKAWDTARAATGLTQYQLHDLRHAGNTWAAATGASTKELMARMGHSNADAALRYQHATDERDQAIARALSDLAKPTSVSPMRASGDRASNGPGGTSPNP